MQSNAAARTTGRFYTQEEVQFIFPKRSCYCKRHNQLDIVVLNLLNPFPSDSPNESDNHILESSINI